MAHPRVSFKRAKAISSSLFLVGLAAVSFTQNWWPGILLVIGIPLALKQLLLGRIYDMFLSLFIFIGGFVVSGYQVSWEIVLPVIFIVGAIYTLAREFLDPNASSEAENEESLNKEIEEHEDD